VKRYTAQAAAVSVMLTAGLVGCSTAPEAGAEGSGTLYVTTNAGVNAAWIDLVIPEFEKLHPNIDVIQDAIDPTTLQSTAAQLYASSSAPDVGFLQTSMAAYATLIDAGALTELNDVWEISGLTDAVQPNVVASWSVDDNHYGIAYNQVWAPVIYYNKALFEQAGITAPDGRVASSSEWLDLIGKLKDAGLQPLAIGGGEFPALHIAGALLQASSTGTNPYSDYLTNTLAGSTTPALYSSGPFLDAMTTIDEWNELGVFAKGTPSMTEGQSVSLFSAGGAAMLSNGSWAVQSAAKDSPDLDFGWFLYPMSDTGTETTFLTYVGDGMVIPKTAKNPIAAKLFLEYLAGVDGQALLVSTGSIPIRGDLPASTFDAFDAQTAEMIKAMSTLGGADIWSPDPTVNTAVTAAFSQILIGEKTPQQVGDEVQAIVDSLR